jgi:DNA-binding response OmpR family regulator
MKRVGTLDSDKQRVLLVDDEAAFAAMLLYHLETHGFLVEHVTNGQEALAIRAEFFLVSRARVRLKNQNASVDA